MIGSVSEIPWQKPIGPPRRPVIECPPHGLPLEPKLKSPAHRRVGKRLEVRERERGPPDRMGGFGDKSLAFRGARLCPTPKQKRPPRLKVSSQWVHPNGNWEKSWRLLWIVSSACMVNDDIGIELASKF